MIGSDIRPNLFGDVDESHLTAEAFKIVPISKEEREKRYLISDEAGTPPERAENEEDVLFMPGTIGEGGEIRPVRPKLDLRSSAGKLQSAVRKVTALQKLNSAKVRQESREPGIDPKRVDMPDLKQRVVVQAVDYCRSVSSCLLSFGGGWGGADGTVRE